MICQEETQTILIKRMMAEQMEPVVGPIKVILMDCELLNEQCITRFVRDEEIGNLCILNEARMIRHGVRCNQQRDYDNRSYDKGID